ncbi:MAG: exosome non-catalytic core subunit rrp40 [Piccolia ochrophora]|nr:MAG: exosome non-catalytic core subunit rrp40 [Piccolia ochrophora]
MTFLRCVLPGDPIPSAEISSLSQHTGPLKLGPGLRHIPPSTIHPTIAGELWSDGKKNALWVENSGGRYVPTVGDTVLAVVHHSSPEYYHCAITAHTSFATLPQLAFENATRKTRPLLVPGSLVYARVSLADKHMDPELECVNPSTGRADGLGELKGGMVFDVSMTMARRLLMPDPAVQGSLVVLDACAAKVAFEVAVGRNGRIWIDAGHVRKTLAVGRAVVDVDAGRLNVEGQKKLVGKLLREF